MQSKQQLHQTLAALAVPTPNIKYRVVVARGYANLSLSAVRPKHAEGVVRKPAALTVFEHEGPQLFVATQQVKTRKGSFVQMAVGVDMAIDGAGEREILGGFRLFGQPGELDALADPAAAFTELLSRYAVPYRPSADADDTVLFCPLVLAPQQRGDSAAGMLTDLNEVMGVQPRKGQVMSALTKPVNGVLRARWPFIIDTDAYGADIRRYQR